MNRECGGPLDHEDRYEDLATVRIALLAKPGAEETFTFDPATLLAKIGAGYSPARHRHRAGAALAEGCP